MRVKVIATALVLVMLVPWIAACSLGGTEVDQSERVLRVASTGYYGENGQSFRQQFSEIYEFVNPNVTIEFTSANNYDSMYYYGYYSQPEEEEEKPLDKLKGLMEGDNPPDIVLLSIEELQHLVNENMLQPLDSLATRDDFDTADIVPAVMEGLKSASPDGRLYALAPFFSSSALVYNRAIFNEAAVPYPEDGMTWDEIFALASRVYRPDSNQRIFGFSFMQQAYPSIMEAMNIYTAPLGLSIFSSTEDRLTVDSDRWESVWSTLINLEKEKIIPSELDYEDQEFMMSRQQTENNPFGYDDFLSGRLAMAIIPYSQLSQIDNANRSEHLYSGFTAVDYGVVTMPSHPEYPGVASNVYVNGIMAINAKAENADDAWEFIKFVNGEDWARAKSNNTYQLVSRKSYITARQGTDFNLDAFLNVIPATDYITELQNIYARFPNYYMVQNLGYTQYNRALRGEISIREALKIWQTEGDLMLQQMGEEGYMSEMDIMRSAAGSARAVEVR